MQCAGSEVRESRTAEAFWPFFRRSNYLNFMVPVLTDSSWAHHSPYTKINRWKLPEKFLMWRAIRNFEPRSRPISDDLKGNESKFMIQMKNDSQGHKIFLCLVMFQKSHFSRLNYQLKFVLFFMQGQLGLQIRIWDHSQTHFDVTNLLVVSKLPNELWLKVGMAIWVTTRQHDMKPTRS